MAQDATQVLADLRSDDSAVQQRVLRSIRASGSNESLQQLASSEDGAIMRAIVALLQAQNLHCEAHDVAENAWYALVSLIDALPKQSELATRVVHEFGLLTCLERGCSSIFFSVALSCILALKRHDVELYRDDSPLARVLVGALCTSSESVTSALLQVLQALSLEHKQWSADILKAIRDILPGWSEDRVALVMTYMLGLVESRTLGASSGAASLTSDSSKLMKNLNTSVYADIILHALRSDVLYVRAVIMGQLHFRDNQTFADTFVALGGIAALVAIVARDEDALLREKATDCLCQIAEFSDAHRREIIALQIEHEHCELLPKTFYSGNLDAWSASTDFVHYTLQLCSGDAVAIRQCLVMLPKNTEVLAAFCISHNLVSMLAHILRDVSTSEDIHIDVWGLLVHIIYELPRLGIAKLPESSDLASLALSFVSLQYSAAARKLAIMYLMAPLNKYRSIRHHLMDDEGAIPLVAGLLAQESDCNVAGLLSDLLRSLVAGDQSCIGEMDLVVRGILDCQSQTSLQDASKDAKCAKSKPKCYFMNLLSLYRYNSSGALGSEALDNIRSLQLLIEVLENGSELEKLVALKQLHRYAASWGPIHLALVRDNIRAIACVLVHEAAELKQIAVDVLHIVADLDKGCRTNVLAAQAQLWPDDPIFSFDESCADDDLDDDDDDDYEYAYSDQESADEAYGESSPKRQRL